MTQRYLTALEAKWENSNPLIITQRVGINGGGNTWVHRMLEYGFAEGVDFVGCKLFNTLANQELTDYALTIDCAKEIAMLQPPHGI